MAIIERLFLAAILGGVIGWERDLRNKQAGFKTHLLVAVGSALIMILSIYGFNETIDHINARFDPARLAHGVISGIGFLGAGAIMKHNNNMVSGITTAATLWVVAAIGLCVGSGYFVPAFVTTGIILINVYVLRGLESKFLAPKKYVTFRLKVSEDAKILGDINKLLKNENAEIKAITMSDEYFTLEEGQISFNIQTKISSKENIMLIANKLSLLEGVTKVTLDNNDIASIDID